MRKKLVVRNLFSQKRVIDVDKNKTNEKRVRRKLSLPMASFLLQAPEGHKGSEKILEADVKSTLATMGSLEARHFEWLG